MFHFISVHVDRIQQKLSEFLFNFEMTFFYVFRGGKICLTDHFKPLWARNVPKFGIAHAMALGVSWSL